MRALVTGHDLESSPVGIALAIASLLIMPFLSWAQRRTGRRLGSAAVVADSTQTLLCTYLSAVLLAGLLLNASLGWSWGRPHRRPGHRCGRRQGGPRGMARRRLLRPRRPRHHLGQRRAHRPGGRLRGARPVVRATAARRRPTLAPSPSRSGTSDGRSRNCADASSDMRRRPDIGCVGRALRGYSGRFGGRGRPGAGDVQIRRCDAPLKSRTVPVANSACGEAR